MVTREDSNRVGSRGKINYHLGINISQLFKRKKKNNLGGGIQMQRFNRSSGSSLICAVLFPLYGLPWQLSWKRSCLQCSRPQFYSWVRKIHWTRDRLPAPVFLDFPGGSAGKESTCSVGDLGSITGLGRSPEKGKGYPLQYSGLENSRDFIVHGVVKSRTQLSDFHFLSSLYPFVHTHC